jgi:hypothetical protein
VDSQYHGTLRGVFLCIWSFYLEEGKIIWKVNWSVGVTSELFCLLTDRKEPLHKNHSTVAVAGAD